MAYVASYSTSDLTPSAIDIIAGLLVGIAGQSVTIGQVVALTISISLLLGLIVLVLKGISHLKREAGGMGRSN